MQTRSASRLDIRTGLGREALELYPELAGDRNTGPGARNPDRTSGYRQQGMASVAQRDITGMADSHDHAEDYWTRLREDAAARPELTPERRDRLAALVHRLRLRRAAA